MILLFLTPLSKPHPKYVDRGSIKNIRRANESVASTKMKHLAAYLLLGLAGNSDPSADDIKGVLSAVGIEADDDRLDSLLGELKGKDINEVR